jgi:hypothetical protein
MKLYVPKGYRRQALRDLIRIEDKGPGARRDLLRWLHRNDYGGLWTPPPSFARYESSAPTIAGPPGTVVTAHATIHTKGSYTELIAATGFDSYEMDIVFGNVGSAGVASDMLVDIAIGGAADETVIIANLMAGYAMTYAFNNQLTGQSYYFPLYIPSGSRISARCQALITSDTVNVSLFLRGAPRTPVWAGQEVTTYGANTAVSGGTDVVCGASAATGDWTEIEDSTTAAHYYIAAGVGGNADAGVTSGAAYLDIGVGAATETAIIEKLLFSAGGNEFITFMQPMGVYAPVPAGSRLVTRISQVGAAQTLDAALYGVS